MVEEIRLPEISENVDSGDVIKVLVNVDDYIEKDQEVVEVETEKAAFDVPSPVKGKIVEICIKQGDKVKVGQVLLKVDSSAEFQKAEEKTKPQTQTPQTPQASQVSQTPQTEEKPREFKKKPDLQPVSKSVIPVAASPSVRRLARQLDVDIQDVAAEVGSDRITAEDVKAYAKGTAGSKPKETAETAERPLPDFAKWGQIERKKVTVTREKIADTLSYTWSHIPQVTQYDHADITGLEEARKRFSGKGSPDGSKVTITSIIIKIAAMAMKEFPDFNATYDTAANEIIYKRYYHISVAVDTDRGLLVPVIRDVDKKNIQQLSAELNDLAQRTRQRKVTPEEMMGGNFTVSNLGGIGGSHFAPIIYWPQAAILGISRASLQPCVVNGRIESRLILPLSLSYDHRIIDGAQGIRFLRRIVDRLENPFLLTLEQDL